MRSLAHPVTPGILTPKVSATHRIALAFVWMSVAASGVVFTEPAPVDVLMLTLVVLLPVIGLVRITPPLMVYLSIWLVAATCAIVATVNALEPGKALTHTAVTFVLTAVSFILAAFVMKRPVWHTRLIFNAYTVAALLAAIAGIIGYFDVLPGAFDAFTRYGRATGTFKDPNVLGPFLVPPMLYMLHGMLTRRLGGVVVLAAWTVILGFAVLISFSRGAWINLGIAVGVFGYLAFVTARSDLQRLKIIGAAFVGVVAAVMVLGAALQLDAVARLFEVRASMDQSYDQGPEGRFGGQEKARRLILEHPLGIGAQQFAPHFHLEEPHNVYLAMFLNAGWLGGLIFVIMTALTCLYGLRHALRPTETQGLFLVAYACFLAHAIEGFVIDLDHWRHFHLLMALVWGLMLGDRRLLRRPAWVDPRSIVGEPEQIMEPRPARVLIPVRPGLARRPPAPRRDSGRDDSRPSRADGRTFGQRRR